MQKFTAKISILLFSIFSCLVLFSCADPNNDNNIVDETQSKEELYKSIIGTWKFESSDNGYYNYDDSHAKICISDKCIKRIERETKQETTIWLYEDVSTIKDLKEWNENNEDNDLRYSIKELLKKYSEFNDYDLCFFKSPYDEYNKVKINLFKILNNKLYEVHFAQSADGSFYVSDKYKISYKLDTSSSNNNSEENNTETSITESDITGSYTISEANGSTFTFTSDGTWTYKYNSSSSNGTWSVSDGKLTITYSLSGYSSTAVFSASISGDTYTLIGKSGNYTTIISSAFMITDQDAVANGLVTLVKK